MIVTCRPVGIRARDGWRGGAGREGDREVEIRRSNF